MCEVLAGPFDCSSQIYSCLCYCGYLFGLRNCNLNVFNVILVVRPACLRCLLYLVCLFCVCLNVSYSWLWFQFSLTVNCLLAPDVRLIVEHHRDVGGRSRPIDWRLALYLLPLNVSNKCVEQIFAISIRFACQPFPFPFPWKWATGSVDTATS